MLYDAFISYSHAKDRALTAALQSAMQRLGKPWYRRRALRLFRDDTSLTATPHLWPSIEQALGRSRFLILMASPEAAASPWVDKEVATWLDRNSSDTVLIALADGDLDWDDTAGDFNWSNTTPLPSALKGRFTDEPRWIDLRAYREGASPRDARFTDLAADLAATLHGRPKEDLLSQEVRQQRRALRLAGSAVALLVVLLALASWQWTIARAQRNRAEHNLALATQTANGLVFNLAQKFRDSGVPVAVISNILDQAIHLQEQLTESGETAPALRRSQCDALGETVLTLLAIGDTKGALAAAQRARDIAGSLAALVPDSTDYQRALSLADTRVGEALEAQGDLAGALAANRDGLVIDQALTKRNPDDVRGQADLSVDYNKIGSLLRDQGDLAGALASYRESMAIRRALAEKDPSNVRWQEDIALSDDRIIDALLEQKDLDGALAASRDELAIRKMLAEKNPGNTDGQRNLSVSYEKIGDVQSAQGDLSGALAPYRDGLAIRTALAKQDPTNSQWQRDLSIADGKLGQVLQAQGDPADALSVFRDGLAIQRALIAKDPSNTTWQIDLVVSLYKVASLGGDAQANLTEALAILNRLDAAGKLASRQKSLISAVETALARVKR